MIELLKSWIFNCSSFCVFAVLRIFAFWPSRRNISPSLVAKKLKKSKNHKSQQFINLEIPRLHHWIIPLTIGALLASARPAVVGQRVIRVFVLTAGLGPDRLVDRPGPKMSSKHITVILEHLSKQCFLESDSAAAGGGGRSDPWAKMQKLKNYKISKPQRFKSQEINDWAIEVLNL